MRKALRKREQGGLGRMLVRGPVAVRRRPGRARAVLLAGLAACLMLAARAECAWFSACRLTTATIQNGTILGEDVSDNSIPATKIQPNIVGSVEGVSNDGGDIDLIPGSNISILANDAANTITISAMGLATGDITAVNAGTGLDGGGVSGDVTLQIEVPLVLVFSDNYTSLVAANRLPQ